MHSCYENEIELDTARIQFPRMIFSWKFNGIKERFELTGSKLMKLERPGTP